MRYLIFVFFFVACGDGESAPKDNGTVPTDVAVDVVTDDGTPTDGTVTDGAVPDGAVVDAIVDATSDAPGADHVAHDQVGVDGASPPDQGVRVDAEPPTDAEPMDAIVQEDVVEPVDAAMDAAQPDAMWEDSSDVIEVPTLDFNLAGHNLYINCMPIVSPDPILGSFTSDVFNPGTGMFSEDLMIVEARLEVSSGTVQESYYFSVEPHVISVQSQTGIQTTHQKVADSLLSDGGTSPCQLCDGQWTLHVTVWQGSNGVETTKSLGPSSVECVY